MSGSRAIVLAAFLAAGCGTTSSQPALPGLVCTAAEAAAVSMIRLADYTFEPACSTVAAGTEVTFFNDDSILYEVATQAGQAEQFDSGTIPPGAIFRHTFSTPGEVALESPFYVGMQATILVTAP